MGEAAVIALNVTNELIGIAAGIITTFVIPWVNRKLHLSIPDTPQTTTEVTDLIDRIRKTPSANPEVTPPETGAK